MAINPPRLDDRGFDDLVEELLARIPAHTPEWVPQQGDPGRTMLELFAWLADTILYRANLVPERQRLAFLRLLGQQLRAAEPARGLITVQRADATAVDTLALAPFATVPGPVAFETRGELTVLPVTGECYYKRPLSARENEELGELLDELREFYGAGGAPGYVTTPVFVDGRPLRRGLDLVQDTADRSLWIALLAAPTVAVEDARTALAGGREGSPQLINVGIAPAIELPAALDDIDVPGRIPHVWEISTGELVDGRPIYTALTVLADSTRDLTRRGVQRLVLPGDPADFGVVEGDVRRDSNAGVGDRPPRLDDPDKIARLVAWLRLRPRQRLQRMGLSFAAINAVEIDQQQTTRGRVIGRSDGSPDQVMPLPNRSVDAATFELQVEETDRGYVRWQRIDDLATAGRDDAVYALDAEAGSITFGNGVFGRVPDPGRRVRVAVMRAGGGSAGNLPAGTLTAIRATDPAGQPLTRALTVVQGLPTEGGRDAESLAEAELRIPARLRNRNRSVTASDYRELAVETPGVRIARVEVLPRFVPQQRRQNVPGAVSVMVLPYKELPEAPNPRPDQPIIERVFDHLDARRPLATELYVIGGEYVPVGLSVGLSVNDGADHDRVLHDVRNALRRYLWPLPPDGPAGKGWPLGKAVVDRELAVAAARVEGVLTVDRVNVFTIEGDAWRMLPRAQACDEVRLALDPWQLPELMQVVVSADGIAAEDLLAGVPDPFADDGPGDAFLAFPVVPDTC